MNDYLFCFQVEESDRRVREEEKKRQRDLELKRQREEEVSYGHFCTLAQFHYVIVTLLKWSVYSIQCIVHVYFKTIIAVIMFVNSVLYQERHRHEKEQRRLDEEKRKRENEKRLKEVYGNGYSHFSNGLSSN